MKVFQYALLWITVFCSSSLLAQTTRLLTGKWYYSAIRREDEQEPVSQILMEFAVGKHSFKQFNVNNRVVAYENNDYSYGSWKLTNDHKKVISLSDKGEVRLFTITSLTADTLILYLDHKYVSFVHAHDSLSPDKGVNTIPAAAVKATRKQLVHKWVFNSLTDSVGTPRFLSNMFKGTWYDLKEDGTYARKTTSSRAGNWELQENGRLLVAIDDNGIGSCWYILDISNQTLTLQKPGSNDRIIYQVE